MAGEIDVAAFLHVDVHSDFTAETMDLLDPAALDRGNKCRMRIERKMRRDFSLQREMLAIGRQDQFDGRGRKSDPVIDHSGFVFLVGRDGKYLGFFPPGTSADRMIDSLRPQLAITQR